MANVSQKTLQWLYSVLSKQYRDPNRAYSDLAQTLERFPTISPRTDVYTFENGSPALLLHLVGTLPASFRNVTYRFPVELWIPHTYPHDSPITYITPTSDMLVRPGRHVSGEGRVYHPYLAHWAQAWDRSNMVELLSVLADVFSKEPPVISRPQLVNAPQQPPRPPPVPPPLHEQSRESVQSPGSSTARSAPPRPPPKQQLASDSTEIPSSSLGRYDVPLPLPNATWSTPSQSSYRSYSISASPSSQSTSQGNASLRQSRTLLHSQQQQHPGQTMPQQPQTGDHFSTLPAPSVASASDTRVAYRSNSVPQSETPSQQIPEDQHRFQAAPSQLGSQLQQNQRVQTQYQQQPIHREPIAQPKPLPVNLLDSPFDINLPVSSLANIPAPPIPPNPEKDALLSALSQSITQALHNDISQNATSLPLLQSQNEALNKSLHTLESELAQLQTLQNTLTDNITILQSSLREADSCISSAHARAQRGEIPKIDDMLTAPTVVGKQLYDVVCDERGIEAAIWALQAALTRGRMTMEAWAKKTRELSREGFKKKVLSKKIASGMGLETWSYGEGS